MKPPRTKVQTQQDRTNRAITSTSVPPANWPYCPTCGFAYPPSQGNTHNGH